LLFHRRLSTPVNPFEAALARVVDYGCLVERLLTVEFGPSRSKRFGKAVAEARGGAGDCCELEPGRYRTRFLVGSDATVYTSVARLLERVRRWRATEVYEGEELVSTFHAREMAWCASSQLRSFRDCRFRFHWGIPPRCSLCPLFDAQRAVRDALGENMPEGMAFEIRLAPRLRALLAGESPLVAGKGLEPDWIAPDFPPPEWGQPDEPNG
jgi:hypothetical protein